MSDESVVSDVNPDDLAKMIKGIDDFDDDLFGKKQPNKSKSVKHDDFDDDLLNDILTDTSKNKKTDVLKGTKVERGTDDIFGSSSEKQIPRETESSVLTQKEEVKSKPKSMSQLKPQIDFGDDDILGNLDGNTSSKRQESKKNFMDDIFGSKKEEKPSKSSFLDGILGKQNKEENENPSTNTVNIEKSKLDNFTLDTKYKKQESSIDQSNSIGGLDTRNPGINSNQPRRRRGNPTIGGEINPIKEVSNSQSVPENTSQELRVPTFSGKTFESEKSQQLIPPEKRNNQNVVNESNIKTEDSPFPWMSSSNQSKPESEKVLTESKNKIEENPFPWMTASNESKVGGQSTVTESKSHIVSSQSQVSFKEVQQENTNIKTIPREEMPSNTTYTTPPQYVTPGQPSQLLLVNQELDDHDRLLAQRKAQHEAELLKQRQQLAQQMQELQNRQSQMVQHQSEQGQKLLEKLQTQMEEETFVKQKMMNNQIQILATMQMDSSSNHMDIFNILERKKINSTHQDEDESSEIKNIVKEKIEEIEEIYKLKEKKLIENYEYVINDLEKKLDQEQERYNDMQNTYKQDKFKIHETYKEEIKEVKNNNKELFDSMKSEYMSALQCLRELRKVETDSAQEVNENAARLSNITTYVDESAKTINKIQEKMDMTISSGQKNKETMLQLKDKELTELQQSLVNSQVKNDTERHKLYEVIYSLETQMRQKQTEIEADKRELTNEKENYEFKLKAYEMEKESLLDGLKKEKKRISEEKEKSLKDLDKIKSELTSQFDMLQKERTKYLIHKKLNIGPENIEDRNDNLESSAINEALRALEDERKSLKQHKGKIKTEMKIVTSAKQKLNLQKKELATAIDKLYEVECGINEKFKELEKLRDSIISMKDKEKDTFDTQKNLNFKIIESVKEIELHLVDLIQQEQKIKSECINLTSERRKLQNTRKSLLCSSCSHQMKRQSSSARDLRWAPNENTLQRKQKHNDVPLAWMDIDGGTVQRARTLGRGHRGIPGSRTSGDGASFEALDTNVNTLRKEAQSDHQYLQDEMDYLNNIQQINPKTFLKYK